MIILRELKEIDADYMLEWMKDMSVCEWLDRDFESKTLDDCVEFIKKSNMEKSKCLHMAIVDSKEDTYLGTVSLKNIDDHKAEFAIVVRKCAMGLGIAMQAMERIIEIGFCDLGLKSIYWYVKSDNIRALRFYDKNGYTRIDNKEVDLIIDQEEEQYVWYKITK